MANNIDNTDNIDAANADDANIDAVNIDAANRILNYTINNKSLGGWKNYKEMLDAAIDIITKTDKYRNLTA